MRRSTTFARGLALRKRRLDLRDESGMALVLALGIVLVLAIVVTTVITFTASGARDSSRVNAGQKAYALAEAGVNNALAVLNANYPVASSVSKYPGPRCLLGQKAAPAGFPGTEYPIAYTCAVTVPQEFTSTPDSTRPNETVTWWGRIRIVPGLGPSWVINSTGSVPNPTGPGTAAVTRTIHAKVPVVQAEAQNVPPGVLNFVYSVKDAVLGQGVELKSPLYVRGNLTIENTAEVRAPIYVTCVEPPAAVPTMGSPCPSSAGNVWMGGQAEIFDSTNTLGISDVSIGGSLEQTTNNNAVGRSSARLTTANIVNGCKKKSSPWNNPCRWDLDNVYVDTTGVPLDAFGLPIPFANGTNRNNTMPPDPVPVPPDSGVFADFYTTAQPGPVIPCDQGTYPPVEQGDMILNVSVPGIVNLTPDFDYSCTTQNGVDGGGEISWDVDTLTLTVSGTIFIDGSAEISRSPSDPPALYQGQGTIYVAGTFGLKNTKMCAVIDNDLTDDTPCNLSAWNPNLNALVIVAMSKGDANVATGVPLPPSQQSASGENSIEIVSSDFQGALIGVHNVSSITTAVIQGPVISTDSKIILRNTAGASFPPVNFAPGGAPGYEPPPTLLLPPQDFGGG